jgi:diguanylate cyclase (GGDEF)-like protein/PAS domain S-box-containing protein
MATPHAHRDSFREAFEGSGAVMMLAEPKTGRIVDVNPACLAYYGYPRHQIVGMSLSQINTLPWDRIALERKQELFPERNSFYFRHRLASGEERDVEVYFSPVSADQGPLLLSIVHDVTRLKQAQEELQASEATYRTAFQTTLDAVSISRSSDGLFIDVNEAFLETMGYTREEVVGRTSLELGMWTNAADRRKFVDTVRKNHSCRNMESRLRRKSGEVFWGLVSGSLIEIDRIHYLLAVWTNVSDVKEALGKIDFLSSHDPLTGLPNRQFLLDRLQAAMAGVSHGQRLQALLLIDLDDFKGQNAALGHHGADLLLKEVANRLTAAAGRSDMVVRLGADRFALLLTDLSIDREEAAAQAKARAEKARAALGRTYRLQDRHTRSTSCIGITIFGNKSEVAEDVIRRAELGLSKAKQEGRNSLSFFSHELEVAVAERASMEDELRKAIKSNQLMLYYQPQVDSTGLIGAEALIRWNHPRRGMVMPGEFIPLAEQTGLILPMGAWALEAVCKQVKAWSRSKRTAGLTLGVNISVSQFRQPDFVAQVLHTIERIGAHPERLHFELTESLMVDDIDDVIAKMGQLKAHGIQFSLDDFGTGYSSLTYLRRMPLTQLKIDRSFVRDIVSDRNSCAIAQTIVSLADAMGLSIIAEGVETREQQDLLMQLGCGTFQG